MKATSWFAQLLAALLVAALVVPSEVSSQSQAGQHAGEVARVIPAVSIQRGPQRMGAQASVPVLWEDVVNTQSNGRARVALDDGSVLNVGADSSLRIAKHDPAAQQTELDLSYGRMRSKAVRVARPDGKYEVRTPAGVAGVVGTDFYVLFANGLMQVIVFEGTVRVCDLAGNCVVVGAGMTTTVRQSAQGTPPTPPTKATPSQLTEATKSTEVGPATDVAVHKPLNPWVVIGLVTLVAAPAIAVPLATRGKPAGASVPCNPNTNIVAKGCP
jgi:hypothetical protein